MDRRLSTNITRIKYKNNYIVYENFIKCTVKDYEYNLSYNPTLLSGSQGVLTPYSSSDGGSIVYINTGSNINYGILKGFVNGEDTTNYSLSTSFGSLITGGESIGLVGDDVISSEISIGFDFEFYGKTYSSCYLSSNGDLQFVTNDPDYNNNYSLPYTPNFGPTIFALWSDLVINPAYRTNPGVYVQTIGIPGNRVFIADWRVNFYDDIYEANFQIRLYEGTNIIELVYGYINNPDNNSIAIGIQDGNNNFIDYYNGNNTNVSFPIEETIITFTPIPSNNSFSPYVTTVGLYNDAQELLAIGKMAAPMPLSNTTDTTFLIKYDLDFTSKVVPMPSPSPTPPVSPSVTVTVSPTPSISVLPTVTPTVTVTPSETPSITPTISTTPVTTITPTPTLTSTPSITPSVTPTVTPSITPTITPSITPSITPTKTPSVTPSKSKAPTVSYIYNAEIRYCNDCGFNAGNITVGSYSPIGNGNYAYDITQTTPPQTVVYKIVSTTTGTPSVIVAGTGTSCVFACDQPID